MWARLSRIEGQQKWVAVASWKSANGSHITAVQTTIVAIATGKIEAENLTAAEQTAEIAQAVKAY